MTTNDVDSGRSRAGGRTPTLLSDALVRDLMAAGQADILVGLPTLNHVSTVGKVARAVNELFTTVYARERTVLFTADGGSTDGTQAAIIDTSPAAGDLVLTSFALRTTHRITAPYHGVPGRGSAIRLILAAADLLNVRAVAVVSPDAAELAADDIARLLHPVLESGADYVKPALPRALHEGPLVTQLVRPLLGAVFGVRLLEPVDPLLACSRAFGTKALQSEIWDTPFTQYGLDPWLGAVAAFEGFNMAQAQLRLRRAVAHDPPQFADVFRQVVGSVFGVIAKQSKHWMAIDRVRDTPMFGEAIDAPPERSGFRLHEFERDFRQGVDVLYPLLVHVLRADTLAALQACAHAEEPVIDDALWVRTVYQFVAGAAHHTLPLDQLIQTLQPLYLGRLSTMLREVGSADTSSMRDRHERLAFKFEELKPELVAAWPMSGVG